MFFPIIELKTYFIHLRKNKSPVFSYFVNLHNRNAFLR